MEVSSSSLRHEEADAGGGWEQEDGDLDVPTGRRQDAIVLDVPSIEDGSAHRASLRERCRPEPESAKLSNADTPTRRRDDREGNTREGGMSGRHVAKEACSIARHRDGSGEEQDVRSGFVDFRS